MKEPRVIGIYVDLDALLDFRIATIASISEDAAVRILNNGYHDRITDTFDGIEESQYHDLYSRRGIETIGNARMTSMVFILKAFMAEIANESINGMGVQAKVTVNTFPVEFSEDVKVGFAGAMNYWLGDTADIEFVSHTPQEFNHDELLLYKLVIKYEYGEWLNGLIAELATKPCRDTILMVPSIFFDKKMDKQEWERISRKYMNPFDALTTHLMLMIQLNVVDTKFFSVIRPEDLEFLEKGAAEKVRKAIREADLNAHSQSQGENQEPLSQSGKSPQDSEHQHETAPHQEPPQGQEDPPEEQEFLAL